MKGYEMILEISLFNHVPHIGCGTWFKMEITTLSKYDHSPSFTLGLELFDWEIFKIFLYNAYHEVEED